MAKEGGEVKRQPRQQITWMTSSWVICYLHLVTLSPLTFTSVYASGSWTRGASTGTKRRNEWYEWRSSGGGKTDGEPRESYARQGCPLPGTLHLTPVRRSSGRGVAEERREIRTGKEPNETRYSLEPRHYDRRRSTKKPVKSIRDTSGILLSYIHNLLSISLAQH